MKQPALTRRTFIMTTAAAALGGCATTRTPSLKRLGYKSPNEKLNIAGIGAGGKGSSDIDSSSFENIVAIADVDWRSAAKTFGRYPNAKKYRDFRVMLDKENIDAVTVSTADHIHAFASMAAMKRGIHVYVQKPMTHSIYEARKLTEAARKYNVATQMGNQGHSNEEAREVCEIVWSGAIGLVREVHVWSNRPVWPQGIAEPLPEQPVPDYFDWDMWLGPAPWRPYNRGYAPFKWRGWFDFGTGALGDMGCHLLDTSNWALRLGYPESVECLEQEGKNDQTYPNKAIIRYEFPARGSMPPVTLTWYDGGNKPPRFAGTENDPNLDKDGGSIFIGDKGILTSEQYGRDWRLLPDSLAADFKKPTPLIPRSTGHYTDWIQACKGGVPACSNFDYAGPFTEWVLLGNLALRCEGKLLWDGPKMRCTNNKEANRYVKCKYRKGWKL